MTRFRLWLAGVLLLGVVSPAGAQPTLPLADEVEWDRLRDHCGRLLEALQALKAPLPAETERALRTLLKQDVTDKNAAAEQVQKLLDAHCLVGVTINPESRVKAARGPAEPILVRGREAVVLVKVHNQAGVTKVLAVEGPHLRTAGPDGDGRWLEATLHTEPPLGKALTGDRLEYRVLRLTAREAGKREALLKFDAGQGTQDLGFRAEVPVLFVVKNEER